MQLLTIKMKHPLTIIVLISSILLSNLTHATIISNGDGTVTDVDTGLIWQETDDNVRRTFTSAFFYCQNLNLAGNSSWRLPNIKQLVSIVDYTRENPAIDETIFPSTKNDAYWSSTSSASNPASVVIGVGFRTGGFFSFPIEADMFVRCVR